MSSASNIEKIIEKQARFWEVRERIAVEGGEAAQRALAHLAEGPWISISKQWGSRSRELASKLAGELHWQWFDREILTTIAQHTNSREQILSRLDEHAIGSINDYIAQMVVSEDPGQAAYLQEMIRVVMGLAKQGNAIIVGRGANFFLDPRFGLRVRLVAPLEARVAHVAELEGCSRDSARPLVEKNDTQQAAFIRQVFGHDIDDPLGFDLMLNMGGMDEDTAVHAILAALRQKLQARG
jgi:cytidylate kinase